MFPASILLLAVMALEHILFPTYQYPFSLAVQRSPLGPPPLGPSTSSIRLSLCTSFLTYLASSYHPTPLHLEPLGWDPRGCRAFDRRFASSPHCQRDFS